MKSNQIIIIAVVVFLASIVGAFFLFGPGQEESDTNSTTSLLETPKANNAPTTTSSSSSGTTTTPTPRRKPETAASRKTTLAISGIVQDPDGGLPDISLRLIPDSAPGKNLAEAVSSSEEGKEGSFAFNVPAGTGTARIAAVGEGWAISLSAPIDLAGDDVTNLVIQVFEDTSLNASVLRRMDDGSMQPVAGASVALVSDDRTLVQVFTELNAEAVSDASGQLSVRGLAPGKPTLRASAPGMSGYRAEGSPTSADIATLDVAAGETLAHTFTLVGEAAGSIKGIVISSIDEAGIPGATLELLTGLNENIDATTSDASGRFEFKGVNTSDPMLAIRATAWGFGYQITRAPATDGSEVKITMSPGCTVEGIVTDESGTPLSGAAVVINDNGFEAGFASAIGVKKVPRHASAVTGGDGRFKIEGVPVTAAAMPNMGGGNNPMMGGMGQRSVSATKDGYGAKSERLRDLTAGGTVTVEIKLPLAGVIYGTITSHDGKPVQGANIAGVSTANMMAAMGFRMAFGGGMQMIRNMPGMAANFDALFGVTSDEAGNYRIENVAPGGYLVGARHNELGSQLAEGLQVAGGEELRVDFTLGTSSGIQGYYFDEVGRKKAGVTLTAMMTGDNFMNAEIATGTTDDTGFYRISNMKPGTYRVLRMDASAGAGGMGAAMQGLLSAQTVSVKDGQFTNFDYYENVPGTTRIYGKVTMNGEVVKSTRLSVGGGGLGGISAFPNVETDENGMYEVRNVPLGSYMVNIQGRGMPNLLRNKLIRVDRTPEQEIDVDFVTLTVTGVVKVSGIDELPDDVRVYINPANADRDGSGNQPTAFNQIMSAFAQDAGDINRKTGEFTISDISPGSYYISARSAKHGMVRVGPLNIQESLTGVRLTIDGGTGSIHALVQNYVPTDDANPMMRGMGGQFFLYDAQGNPVTLGGVMSGSSMVQLTMVDDATKSAEFTLAGVPVGVWTITFQINNHAPVTVKNLAVGRDQTTETTLTLEKSGNLEIQITNDDLDPEASQQLRYRIVASNGTEFVKQFTFMDLLRNMLNPPDPSKKNTFVLNDFPPGSYTMTFDLPGYRQAKKEFTIVSDQTTPISVTFTRE